jgi:hypothetical protein
VTVDADVAHAFGIRGVADGHDADVVAGRRRAGVTGIGHRRLRRDLLDTGEDRRAARDVAGLTLPTQRPATALVAHVVGH